MRFLYLHGFASSPRSRKARFFVEKFEEHGIRLEALDLAPDFRNATLTSQLAIIRDTARGERVILIGSSLGGYLAALYAAEGAEVDRLVLLAPAFDFYHLWTKKLGEAGLANWREKGTSSVYHYGMNRETELGFEFMEDAARYPGFPSVGQRCFTLHGVRDEVVPVAKSEEFTALNPSRRTLVCLDSGHELTDVLDDIWNRSSNFLLSANIL